MSMWDDPKKLVGWKLVEVSPDPETGWIHLLFEKGAKRATYSFMPQAARPVSIEP